MQSWGLGILAVVAILLGLYWLTSFITFVGKLILLAIVVWIVIEIVRKLLPQRNANG